VRWFTPVFLATQEAEIRRIAVRNQPRQIVHETLENTQHKKAGGGVGPEFKPQYHKKKKKSISRRSQSFALKQKNPSRTRGYNWSLLKVREIQMEARKQRKHVFLLQVLLKFMLTYGKGETR
jgi:hypothetical protein